MSDHITPTRQGQLRHPSPLIKEGNTCASCKLVYMDTEVPHSASYYKYKEKPTYACHLHHCMVKLNQWCKHHKRKS